MALPKKGSKKPSKLMQFIYGTNALFSSDKVSLSRSELGNQLYLFTKGFLDKNKDLLSPIEKGAVLKKYIELWAGAKCILDIKETAYSEIYCNSRFGKHGSHYNENVPMIAGFNLQEAVLGNLHFYPLLFLSVNLKNADLSNTNLPYSHFENCDLSGIETDQANLNQCRFVKCKLQDANIQRADLDEAYFHQCDLHDSYIRGTGGCVDAYYKNCNLYNAQILNGRSLHFFRCVEENPNLKQCNPFSKKFNFDYSERENKGVDVSNEEMAASHFGMTSHTAMRMKSKKS